MFSLSSAYCQTFTKNTECLLCSFEGQFIRYDYVEKQIKVEKNIKNFLSKEKYGDYVANPPFITKCFYLNDTIFLGLLNGVVMGFNNILKKKIFKQIHSNVLLDLRPCNFQNNYLVSCGKEKCIKLTNTYPECEILYNISLEEEIHCIESDQNKNIYAIGENEKIKILKVI
jgi:hypothetical protein